MIQDLGRKKKVYSNKIFLFTQLCRRDFKQKYKGTVLGIIWSILSPLLQLLIMSLLFSKFFGSDMEHYTTFVFCGIIVMSFYREATSTGMASLMDNAAIFTKIRVPKYMFILSKNISAIINFIMVLIVFFVFCAIDGVGFTPKMFLLIYPTICLIGLNIGVSYILSILYVLFRDISYLYGVFLMLLGYVSATFYDVSVFSDTVQKIFLINPIYVYTKYFRLIVIDHTIPSVQFHLLCLLFPIVFLGIGFLMYKLMHNKLVYHL